MMYARFAHDGAKIIRGHRNSGGDPDPNWTPPVVCKRFGSMGECREPNSPRVDRGCSDRKACGLDKDS